MRCPKCTERNSVAARKCEFCGERFKRKQLPLGLKLAVGGVLVAVTASIAASYVVPKFIDPEQNLARVAKKVAAGPRSVEDATRSKKEFSSAVRSYLKDNGNDKTSDLTAGLQKLLPSSTYEVHIAELPRGIRIVEIDTVLQANGFLVMKTASGSKVFDLPGFEVFDDARILNDTAGPILALIGHSGGPPPHRPQVKIYALLPDFLNDETEKLAPQITGDGRAKFAANNQDILLEVTPNAKGKQHNSSETAYIMLHWKDARYSPDTSPKTAKLVRKLINTSSVAAAPTADGAPQTVATDTHTSPDKSHSSTTASSASSSATGSSTTGSSTERIASAASPVLASAIAAARGADRGGTGKHAKIVVRGLTDTPPTQALMNSLPGVAEATEHERHAPSPPAKPAAGAGTIPVVATTTSGKPNKSKHKNNVVADATSASSSATGADTTSSSTHRMGAINCAGASLRTSPHKGAAVLEGLSRGTEVRITGRDGDWYHVRYHGQDGYIFSQLVDAGAKVASAAPEAPATTSSGHKHHHHTSSVLVADVTSHPTHTEDTTTKHHHKHTHVSAPVIEAPMVP